MLGFRLNRQSELRQNSRYCDPYPLWRQLEKWNFSFFLVCFLTSDGLGKLPMYLLSCVVGFTLWDLLPALQVTCFEALCVGKASCILAQIRTDGVRFCIPQVFKSRLGLFPRDVF